MNVTPSPRDMELASGEATRGAFGTNADIGAVLVVTVTAGWALWAEPAPLTSLLCLLLVCVGFAAWMSRAALLYTTTCFLAATAGAFLVHGATNRVGLFVTDYQEPLVSDSQYFLYWAQEFNRAPSFEALITTWGGAVPVLFGALALRLFGGAYLGIVLLNSAMYGTSIYVITRLLRPKQRDALLLAGVVACTLPLQAFSNSMLAKEPIYLFLASISLHFITRIEQRLHLARSLCLLLGLLAVMFLFRPMGSLLLALVTLWVLLRTEQNKMFVAFIAGAILVVVMVITIAGRWGFPIPLFFMTAEGRFGLENQLELVSQAADSKAGLGRWSGFFTPPISLILAPLLAVVWLVAPFPLLGPSFRALTICLAGEFSFQDLAQVARGADAVIIVGLLAVVLRGLRRFPMGRRVLGESVSLFTIISVLAIAAFQFVESGRHRFSVTPVLLLVGWSLSCCAPDDTRPFPGRDSTSSGASSAAIP